MKRPACRLPLLALAALLLTGCVVSEQQNRRETDARVAAANRQLAQIARLLPGRWNNFAQHQDNPKNTVLLDLTVTAQPAAGAASGYLLTQTRRRADGPARGFLWQLSPVPTGLVLDIRPADRPGAQPCRLPLGPTANGFAGQGTCTIAGEGTAVRLEKEVVIAPGQLRIADRLAGGAATVLEFQRTFEYNGWAGVRRNGQWRLAASYVLANDGGDLSLTDRGAIPLGYRLQLGLYHYRDDQPAILRLAVIDEENGKMVAYAWADPLSPQIGLNLDWFQAGLRFSPPEN